MTALERRMLVEAPFPTVRTIHSVKRWAGVQVQDMDSFFHCLYNGYHGKYRGTEVNARDLEMEEKL